MQPLQQKFLNILTHDCRITPGSRIVIAVSGGSDSMALLHLLAAVRIQLDLSPTAVWVDHGLRPLETPREKATVAAAAAQLNLPLIACPVRVTDHAAANHLSIEHAARELRYKALRTTARNCEAEYIAVAHTADDQAEEILLRLIRGSGRKGLSGMQMRSRDLIRPLLTTDKEELLCWLDEKEIPFCVDSSNADPKYLRNRVRNQLLPFLEKHFEPGIKKSLRKTADSLAVDELLLEELTAAAFSKVIRQDERKGKQTTSKILRQPFCELHPALQRRVVEQLLWQMGSRAAYDHILLIIRAASQGKTNSELHLSRGLRVGIFRDCLEFSYPVGQVGWRGCLL
jgi:tRNA(Ile)-lysidine synthase